MKVGDMLAGIVALACAGMAAAAAAAPAVTYTEMLTFSGLNGSQPQAPLTLGRNGILYGTASAYIGCTECGTVFTMTADGVATVLHTFLGGPNDGAEVDAAVIQARDGSLWGTTRWGGAHDYGTIWKISPDGQFRVVHSFRDFDNDGWNPVAPLFQARDGNLYGTGAGGDGSVFRVTPDGVYTLIANFVDDRIHGVIPTAGLVQTADGRLWGTLSTGGPFTDQCPLGCGSVFSLSPGGALTVLAPFDGSNGMDPASSLTVGKDGLLYGVTPFCGQLASCVGAAFRMTLDGHVTVLHEFTTTDPAGVSPSGPLLQASDGNFYGETRTSGTSDIDDYDGTVYRMTPRGKVDVLHDFASDSGTTLEAYWPLQGLIEDRATRRLYGVAHGGTGNNGATFTLEVAKKPGLE